MNNGRIDAVKTIAELLLKAHYQDNIHVMKDAIKQSIKDLSKLIQYDESDREKFDMNEYKKSTNKIKELIERAKCDVYAYYDLVEILENVTDSVKCMNRNKYKDSISRVAYRLACAADAAEPNDYLEGSAYFQMLKIAIQASEDLKELANRGEKEIKGEYENDND